MLGSRLSRWLFLPLPVESREDGAISLKWQPIATFWLLLSLAFAGYYAGLGQWQTLTSEFVIQDDTREYVFWMQRFVDRQLLPNDLMVDYFQSITPPGYAAIYQLIALLGLAPLWLSKCLPIALGLGTTLFGFGVSLHLFPIPAAGFLSMLLLNQSLWFRDDLSSATPRGFVYLLLLAFLYYLLRRSRVGIGVTIGLQALIYPPLVLIAIGLLFLRAWRWEHSRPRLVPDRLKAAIGAMVLGFGALLPYMLASGTFGPTVTGAEAVLLPDFQPGGRHPYFDKNLWRFWLVGQHSGIIPRRLEPFLIWAGLLLPIVRHFPKRFPLVAQVRPAIAVLPQLFVVSLGLFFTAHAVLLKLFFPARYTTHTIRTILALAAGIGLTILLEALLQPDARGRSRWLRLTIAGMLSLLLIASPHWADGFLRVNNRVVRDPELHQFFRQQPKDSLIATLSEKGNDIPTFGQRSILIGREYALPFHWGYYRPMRQRTIDLLTAQYSPQLAPARRLIQTYGVDFWLVDRKAFQPRYLTEMTWLRSFQPAFRRAIATLKQGTVPAIAQLLDRCAVFESKSAVVLDAVCILRSPVAALPVKTGLVPEAAADRPFGDG
jgi:hypothetical protein